MDDEMQTAEPGAHGVDENAADAVMDLLAEHVPLTLLADLAVAEPRSEAILQAEGLPDDAWWEDSAEEGAGSGAATEPTPEDDVPADPDAAASTSAT
jgi:hypothetical protein